MNLMAINGVVEANQRPGSLPSGTSKNPYQQCRAAISPPRHAGLPASASEVQMSPPVQDPSGESYDSGADATHDLGRAGGSHLPAGRLLCAADPERSPADLPFHRPGIATGGREAVG